MVKKKTKVVNIKNEKFDVYIGRPSKWGNPFKLSEKFGFGRKHVLELYENYIRTTIAGKQLRKELHELEGKRLGCYCKPLACHGDILIKLLEEQHAKRRRK